MRMITLIRWSSNGNTSALLSPSVGILQ
ncbi:hypothetical protein IEO21_09837 [Rhodonia placenta]|uniref:Uncharacterized protein n=1 Tax=Rhodonia placenta TaxID=104341 RepID=A0A8H7NTP1_9APHY|nr:hypothetical protein IEO21_09837 [Postia placenta]